MSSPLDKSICQLEGWRWEDEIPTSDSHGGIITRFYRLHDQAISGLGMDDIRFLIGQNSGLDYLVPIAISKLREELFVETEYYHGDLLQALLSINNEPNYWKTHAKEKQELIDLYTSHKAELPVDYQNINVTKRIKQSYEEFLRR